MTTLYRPVAHGMKRWREHSNVIANVRLTRIAEVISNPKRNPKCVRLPRIIKYLAVPNSLVSC